MQSKVVTGERYRGGELVYRSRDHIGPLEVVDQVDLRSLYFGTPALQSRMRRAEPTVLLLDYTQAMVLPLLFQRPGSVLLLGLGGGSLVRFLRVALPRCRLQVVEYRPAVVEVAEQFFGLPQDVRLSIKICDARRFLMAKRQHYDLILIDLFDALGPAPVLSDAGFLDHCLGCLNPRGIVAMNVWCQTREQLQLERDVAHLFPDCCLSVSMADQDNRVLLGFPGGMPRCGFRRMRQQARELAPVWQLPLLTLVSELWRQNPTLLHAA